MTVSLAHLLSLTIFHSASVLAGHHFCDGEVAGLMVLESPMALADVKPRDLVFTAGYGFHDLKQLVHDLAERQAAGLVIRSGVYMGTVTTAVRTEAESLGLPLIGLPTNLGLRAAVDAVAAELFSPGMARQTFRTAVLEDFLQHVLLGDDVHELLQRLSRTTGNHVTFEAPGEHVDSRPLPEGFRPDDFPRVAPLMVRTLEGSPTPQHIPGSRTTPPRTAVPVRAGGRTLGILSLWETARPNDWRDDLALGQVATALALCLMRRQAVAEVQSRQRMEAFHRLLVGQGALPALTGRQPSGRLQQLEQHVVAVIPIKQLTFASGRTGELPPPEELDRLLRSLEAVLHTPHSTALAGVQDHLIVLAASFSTTMPWGEVQERCRRLPRALRAFLQPESHPLIGVGAVQTHIKDVALSLREAQEALRIAVQTGLPGPVVFFEQLALFRLLSQIARQPGATETVEAVVGPLTAYDTDNGTNLLQTLQVFVENGGNSRQAAEALFIHPNTLQYRLNRVRELIGLDWRDAQDFFMLQMAMQIWRLRPESN